MTSGTTWEHAHKWFVKSVKINITLMEGEGVAAITEIQDHPPGMQQCWVRGVGGGGRGPNITVNPSDSPQSWTPLLQHLSQESNL